MSNILGNTHQTKTAEIIPLQVLIEDGQEKCNEDNLLLLFLNILFALSIGINMASDANIVELFQVRRS